MTYSSHNNIESSLLNEAVEKLKNLLPEPWSVTVNEVPEGVGGEIYFDATITVTSFKNAKEKYTNNKGHSFTLLVNIFIRSAKLSQSEINDLMLNFNNFKKIRKTKISYIPLIITDYFPPSSRKLIDINQISGIDRTGWISITSNEPILRITADGNKRDSKSIVTRSSTIKRLNGKASQKILRTLITLQLSEKLPVTLKELSVESNVAPSTVSKLVPFLVKIDLINQSENDKSINHVSVINLLERWSEDYKDIREAQWYIDPRGARNTLDKILNNSEISRLFAITGVMAGYTHLPPETVPIVADKRMMAFTFENPKKIARALKIYPSTPDKGNICLIPTQEVDILDSANLPYANLPQILIDLISLNNRESDLAHQILEMKRI